MRLSTLRSAVALFTFSAGVSAAGLWALLRQLAPGVPVFTVPSPPIVAPVAAIPTPRAAPAETASAEACPDRKAFTGRYRNLVYGFAVTVPAGLKGYWNSGPCSPDERYGCVCMGDHGRFIPLSDDSSVDAFVGYEMEDGWTARQYEKQEVSYLKQEKGVGPVEVQSSRRFRLGRLYGRRFVVLYVQQGKSVLVDHIIALHKGVEYELILRTTPDRYVGDERAFEKVVASWRLTPREE